MDNYLSYFSALINQPSLLKQRKHLFLLSHMRANTSLIGHLLGDHPEISGYYEMHNGYYSWKSYLRQKLIYSSAHPTEKIAPIMFDKVLHSGHAVSDEILLSPNSIFLISIRQPTPTVKSAVAQFRKKRPEHEFTEIEAVANYYLERIKQLEAYAMKLKGKYFYYDAESIIDKPSEILSSMSSFLSLKTPINETFSPKTLTGKGTSGDHSGNLLKGQIIKNKSNYEDIDLSHELSQELTIEYERVRSLLIGNSANGSGGVN
jgi:hypothetical protein